MTFLLAFTLLQNLCLAVRGIHPSSSTAEVGRYGYMSFHPTPWNVLIRQFCHLLLIRSIKHFKTTVKGFYSPLLFPSPCQAHRNITDHMQGTQSNFTLPPCLRKPASPPRQQASLGLRQRQEPADPRLGACWAPRWGA